MGLTDLEWNNQPTARITECNTLLSDAFATMPIAAKTAPYSQGWLDGDWGAAPVQAAVIKNFIARPNANATAAITQTRAKRDNEGSVRTSASNYINAFNLAACW